MQYPSLSSSKRSRSRWGLASEVRSDERGGMLLYALVVLPVMLSISVLAVDFSRFQAQRVELQKEADRIALLAAKSLPDTEQAENVVIQAATAAGLALEMSPGGELLLGSDSSSISFTIKAEGEAVLDIFLGAAGARDKIFQISASSSAALVPEDYMLIVADGLSLRPPPKEYWGEEDIWPEAGILSLLRAPRFTPENSPQQGANSNAHVWPAWWNDWSDGYARWLTQSCYNPVFSSVKLAALSFVEAAGRRPNRLGLIFSPGESQHRQFSQGRSLNLGGGGEERDALWNAYVETANFISDEACVLFAPPGDVAGGAYQYAALRAASACGSLSQSCLCEASLIVPSQSGEEYFPIGLFEECREQRLVSAKEAIYYHAARNVPHAPGGENITAAIREAYRNLASARGQSSSSASTASLAKQKIVVISDVLPDPSSPTFIETQAWLEKAGITLVLVPVVLEDVPGYKVETERASELIKRFSSYRGRMVHVFPITSLEQVSSSLIPTLAAAGREYVIRS